jgi:lysophospholipase L1-like esterase
MAIFNLNDPVPPSPTPSSPASPDPEPPPRPPRVPLKMALTIVVLAAALLAWRTWRDHAAGIDPGAIADTFTLRWPHPPAPVVPEKPKVNAGVKLPPPSPVFTDAANELDPFFSALWKLEQSKGSGAAGGVVTILHYGDSPTTADLITGDIRARLQERFGDAGRGYTLIAKPWPWYGHRGVEISDHGWKIRTGVGLMREGVYGLGGAAFEGQAGAWSRFKLTESQQSAVDVEYLAKPGGGAFAVEADDQQIAGQTTDAEAQAAATVHVALPPGTKVVSIRPTSGTVTLFGADFRRGAGGLLYDSLGLNGATTSVLARVEQPALWKQEIARAAPALIVVNYGSNESSFGSFVHKQYAAELRLAIQRIRQLAPGASILIMSPMDRGERSGLNDIETMATIPEIVSIQRQVAAETHCAFFDTYDAMGGNGTMSRWMAASPRLVTADLLHPTPQGATIVAGLFIEQLDLGYDRWKMQQGIAIPAKGPAPSAPPAAKPRPVPQHKRTVKAALAQAGKKAAAQ